MGPRLSRCTTHLPLTKPDGGHFIALATPRSDHDEPAWRQQPNPMGTANWFSLATMLWLDPLLRRGAARTLQDNDVWKLSPQDTASHLHEKFQVHWQRELNQSAKSPQFSRAMWATLRTTTMWATALHGLYALLMLVQPTLVKLLLEYLQAPHAPLSTGLALAALLTVSSLVAITLADFGQFLNSTLGVNAKSIVMDSVYHKTLKLPECTKGKGTASGDIVTMAGVDSERLFQGYMVLPWLVVAPLTLLAVFVLIGIEMGYLVGAVGGASMAAILYWGYVSAKAVGQARRQITTVQAERVKLTNEILQGIRVVKLYAWEEFLEERIQTIRDKELALLRSYQYHRVLNTVVLSIAPVFSLALCLAVYVAQGHELTTPLAFAIMAYVNVARIPCTVFANSIMVASEAAASCARIGKFLVADEVSPECSLSVQGNDGQSTVVAIQNANFSWNADPAAEDEGNEAAAPTMTLKNISLTLAPKTLTIVVGPVGSGKSSLVSAILGEIHQVGGNRTVAGRVAYVNQVAWIQHATLQDNILFTSDLDADKYDRVLSACQLQADLAILPDGDKTEIGERGINLSGGCEFFTRGFWVICTWLNHFLLYS